MASNGFFHREGNQVTLHDENGPLKSRHFNNSKTSINPHTGQLIMSASSQVYRDNYDKIFGKNKQSVDNVTDNNQ